MAESVAFAGQKILVTGGSGSFGQALVAELLERKAKVVRVLDHDENGLWALRERHRGEPRLRLLLGDLRDLPRLETACADIDVIIHAAALKHVESSEYNPFEAVKTNVIGTQNVIDAGLEANVEKVVLTSTDKAVNPVSVLGATKLLAEKLIVAANFYRGSHRTAFSCVRFGNVLGSRGSAPLLFREQVIAGGPVTLTDERMTRFVMTLPDAVRLVLKAIDLTRGGETFILKMDAARISDLAAVLIERGGAREGRKVTVSRSGPKPGERLHEELMTEEEASRAYELADMYLVVPNMPELLPVDMKAYPGAKPVRRIVYRSDQVSMLSRQDLAGLMKAEGLL
ncbi:MAG TPA: polysaccharide biosynthesis protein [Thermoplasmata archaeon]|nr:polysaccharide biosynthesis protein [Thermoplasmata archaeon]